MSQIRKIQVATHFPIVNSSAMLLVQYSAKHRMAHPFTDLDIWDQTHIITSLLRLDRLVTKVFDDRLFYETSCKMAEKLLFFKGDYCDLRSYLFELQEAYGRLYMHGEMHFDQIIDIVTSLHMADEKWQASLYPNG